MRTFLDPEYLTEEYFALLKYTANECIKRGMIFWLYDEAGWPSGGANYNTVRDYPDAVVKVIKTREKVLKAGAAYSMPSDTVAVFAGKERLPEEFTPDTDIFAEEYYIHKMENDPNLVDLSDPRATDAFINNTYKTHFNALGDHFGEDIPLIFTDEPILMRESLPSGGFDAFLKRYGYDLRDFLYVIKGNGEEAVTEREIQARLDFGRMKGEQIRDNCFARLRDFSEKCGISFAGHLNKDNVAAGGANCGYFWLVDCLRKFHIPGIDVIWEQIRYPYGGRSPLDEETADFSFFPRLAPSAARQEGKNIALSESFAIYGDAATPEEMKYIINYQVIRGINSFNFLSLSGTEKRCGSLAMRPSFTPVKPGFRNLKHLNDYVARLSYLASLGEAEGDTALYHPAADLFANPEISENAGKSFCALGKSLEDENIPFDIIDDGGIRDAHLTDEGLVLGNAVYRHIVVPECRYMPEDIAKKIAPFIGNGKPICRTRSAKTRIMTRKVDNSRLYFLFNESIEEVEECVDVEDGNIYEIVPRFGNIYKRDELRAYLSCGDIKIFIVTYEELEAVDDIVDY